MAKFSVVILLRHPIDLSPDITTQHISLETDDKHAGHVHDGMFFIDDNKGGAKVIALDLIALINIIPIEE